MMQQDRQNPLTPQWYEIFVAGIPPSATLDILRAYFQRFGPIVNLEFLKIGKKRHANHHPKKFCKLTTPSRSMYLTLTGPTPPQFRGRSLFCQPFMSGDFLAAHSADINSRRIVIKKVPPTFDTSELRNILQREAGEIEVLYQYKSDFSLPDHNSKDHKTFSVTFERHSIGLISLLERRFIETPAGSKIEIEQFCYNRYKGEVDPSTLKLEETTSNNVSIQKNNQKKTSRKQHSKGLSGQVCNQEKTTSAISKWPKIQCRIPGFSIGAEIDINGYRCQQLKPTNSDYHKSRGRHLKDSDSLCLHDPSNIRLNLATPSQFS